MIIAQSKTRGGGITVCVGFSHAELKLLLDCAPIFLCEETHPDILPAGLSLFFFARANDAQLEAELRRRGKIGPDTKFVGDPGLDE